MFKMKRFDKIVSNNVVDMYLTNMCENLQKIYPLELLNLLHTKHLVTLFYRYEPLPIQLLAIISINVRWELMTSC